MSEQLLPPNANELLMQCLTGRAAVAEKLMRGKSGGGDWTVEYGKQQVLARNNAVQIAASTAPAAPNVWPVYGLVLLQGGQSERNISARAFISIKSLASVPVPCMLM